MRRIRVGILGVHPDKGWGSLAHIPALQSLPADYEVVAVAHRDLEQARRAASRFAIPLAFGTTEELVNHPDVDLVAITVKVTHHFELITLALKAGKAVYSEWPLGVDLDEASQLAEHARQTGVQAVVGLQTRAAPAFNYVRDLIQDGYVGEVLSTTLIGSGINWGEATNEQFRYTLDSKSGAGMLQVPCAHSLDAVLYALGTTFRSLSATLAVRRTSSRMIETAEEVPMQTADQIAVSGTLENGVFLATHFRGGLSKGTNFHWEVNGTRGDLLITSPVGYVGVGGFKIQGATDSAGLQELAVPEKYGGSPELGVAQNVALSYARLAQDWKTGSRVSPSFEDAVELHRLIHEIEQATPAPQGAARG